MQTFQKERVKSYEELVIANFLFINGVEYEYEKHYKFDTATPTKRQYTPDFYLKDSSLLSLQILSKLPSTFTLTNAKKILCGFFIIMTT